MPVYIDTVTTGGIMVTRNDSFMLYSAGLSVDFQAFCAE
jgi:hypothetical protein